MRIAVVSKVEENLDEYLAKHQYPVLKYKNLLERFNSVIDWENSTFPIKDESIDLSTEEVKKTYYTEICGNPPTLSPGICFLACGQLLMFLDSDSLICLDSETGAYGITRVVNTKVLSYCKLRDKISYLNIATQEDFIRPELIDQIKKSFYWFKLPFEENFKVLNKEEVSEIPESFEKYYVARYLMGDLLSAITKTKTYKITLESDTLLFPTEFYIQQNRFYFNPDDILDECHVTSILISFLSENLDCLENL